MEDKKEKLFDLIANAYNSKSYNNVEVKEGFLQDAWNGNSFFDKFYKVQNFFPYAIPIVLDNEPPRM
ncbi:hypothetical protein ACOYYN_12790 [Enterococcus lactis]|uniref:hypothetical protein n=1 Tax=Enterococcus TaxID=1350 RepID=UPI002598E3DB|nr:hypothetical protein [Enterococcus faecalis]MDM3980146.1 hypothetical protein [Enterococcus faecalis]